jgi:thiol-disulfide isomerase/thioredoxin
MFLNSMKVMLTSLIGLSLTGFAFGEMQTWTNKEGKTVQLELLKVTEKNGELIGEFKMVNGNGASIKASDLSEPDAKRLSDFKAAPAAGAVPAAVTSVYDKLLEGNLQKLQGKSLKSYKGATKPTKYYVFYHTASWCPPCRKFTPDLVDFYNKNKPNNDEFEVILITSDSDEKSMEDYTVDKQMPWPQLELSKVDRFKKEFKHPGRGIPNLVITDLKGQIIKTSYEGDKYIGPAAVMNHLATLLTKK